MMVLLVFLLVGLCLLAAIGWYFRRVECHRWINGDTIHLLEGTALIPCSHLDVLELDAPEEFLLIMETPQICRVRSKKGKEYWVAPGELPPGRNSS